MSRKFDIEHRGLRIDGEVYIGSTPSGGDDPPECNIESIGFDLLDADGKHVWAELPAETQEFLIDNAKWFEDVSEKAFEQAENASE